MRREVVGAWDPEVIDQAIPTLEELVGSRGVRKYHAETPPVQLPEHQRRVWEGLEPKLKDGGGVDRSATLVKIARALFDAGAERAVIVPALQERDVALGYRKYAGRSDELDRLHEIVDELERNGRNGHAAITFGKGRGTANNSEARGPEENNGLVENVPPEKLSATKVLADVICSDNHFARDEGGKLYRYSDGVYKLYAERYIQQQVKAVLEQSGLWDKWSSHKASEVVEYIRVDAPDLWPRPPLERVNLINGILNLDTLGLEPHSPAFLSPVQLPVAYDPEAECPEWEKFVERTFPEDAQQLAFEIPADLMTPDRSIQKALLLIGEGDNGKSVYLRAIGAFVGTTNVAGVSIHKLESDRFAASRLIGRLANICPDLPSEHLTQTSVFKTITGGDVLNAEYKYRESFEFVPFARLLFSANAAPRAGDASHAFFRRWLVVPFEASFTEEEKLPREILDARLSDPQELSGVLNRALAAREQLRSKGFTESASMQEAAEEFRQMTDPVSVWLDNNTVSGTEAYVPKDTLAREFNSFCQKTGKPGMNKNAFGRALKRSRPSIIEAQRMVNGAKTWCWLGIALGSGADDPTTNAPPDITRNHENHEKSPTCFAKWEGTPQKKVESYKTTYRENPVNLVNPVSAVFVERVTGELRRSESGAYRNLPHYLKGNTTLEILTKSVLYGLGEQGDWRRHAPAVEQAAADPENHPPFCDCEACR